MSEDVGARRVKRDADTAKRVEAVCDTEMPLAASSFEIGQIVDDARHSLLSLADGQPIAPELAELLRRLIRYSDGGGWRAGKPATRIRNRTLSADLRISTRTLQRRLAALESAGWLWRSYSADFHRAGFDAGIDLRPLVARLAEIADVGRFAARAEWAEKGESVMPHDSSSDDAPLQIQNQILKKEAAQPTHTMAADSAAGISPCHELGVVAEAPAYTRTPAPEVGKAVALLKQLAPDLDPKNLRRWASDLARETQIPAVAWDAGVRRHGVLHAAALLLGAVHDRNVRNLVGYVRGGLRKQPLGDTEDGWAHLNPWPRVYAVLKSQGVDPDALPVVDPPAADAPPMRRRVEAALARARIYAGTNEILALCGATADETDTAVSAYIAARKRPRNPWSVDRLTSCPAKYRQTGGGPGYFPDAGPLTSLPSREAASSFSPLTTDGARNVSL